MEMDVFFYELEQPYVYEDPVLHSFYVVTAEPQVCKVSFYSSSDPFTIEPIGTSAAASGQPLAVEQISPSGTAFAGDSIDGSPQSTSEVIIIFYDENIEEIEVVDLTFGDDENLEMDIEIVNLTFDSD
ncbi:hypothetical protein AHAS_Ahas20G0091500 [Arachis hypogaea]